MMYKFAKFKHFVTSEQNNKKCAICKSFKTGYEAHRDKTNKMACAPCEDSDQLGHPPSLIRVFALRSVGS